MEILPPVNTTILPFGFPNIMFNDDNVDDFYFYIVESHSEANIPSIKTCNIEKGKMKIVCINEISSNLVRSRLGKLAFRVTGSSMQIPIIVLPNNEILSRIELSCILEGNVELIWSKFLTSVVSDNFDGSYWMFREADQLSMNKYKIKFAVDGISFYQLVQNGMKIKIDGISVDIEIEVNPFATDMNNYSQASN